MGNEAKPRPADHDRRVTVWGDGFATFAGHGGLTLSGLPADERRLTMDNILRRLRSLGWSIEDTRKR